MANYAYSPMFPLGPDDTEYELVSSAHINLVEMDGETFLRVDPKGLTLLAERAFTDISHLLRSTHLGQLARIVFELRSQYSAALHCPARDREV